MLLWTLHPQCSAHTILQTFQIIQKCTNTIKKNISHFNSTVSFDFCIRSNKIIILYFCFRFSPFFLSQVLPSHCIAGPAPPQKICSKGTGIKNKKSAVITLFEMTIIKITYNLRFKRCLINFISVLTESIWWQHFFISHSSLDKHTCVSSVPVTSRQDSVTSVIYLLNTAFTCWGRCWCNSLFIQPTSSSVYQQY